MNSHVRLQIAEDLGHGDVPLSEFVKQTRDDPKFYYDSADKVLAGFKDICEQKIAPRITRVFTNDPEQKLE